ncbi:SDR family NAD(P)-dependent oxidoreductase [candidate division KSB1 bacterium]|nr:SDR family NAD(P)-dependent oxidoreductase [candidate division KSB1 bacterium]
MQSLKGKVAVVAGATRGAGRGIARALGEAGATVYCTGRSVRGNPSPYGRPETIEETAELINALGGVGIAIRVDHTIEAEVKALFERVDREHGRLDVLVNSIAGEDPILGGWTSFWETDLQNAVTALRQALLSHVITAKYAAPLMIKKRRGLIAEVIEGDLLFSSGNVLAQLAKFSLKGFAVTMAEELRKHRVAAIAITPGYLRSESMLQHFGVTEENWREGGKKDKNFLESESPLFIGRAIAALAQNPKVFTRSGDITSSWEVAREHGFTDADGRRPDWGKHGEENVIPSLKWMKEGIQRHVDWLERLSQRGKQYLGAKGTES